MNAFIIIAILFALFWLLLIRPQRRRQAAQDELIRGVEVGDEIVTAGGLYGFVREIHDDELLVEIAPGTRVRVARRAVGTVIEPEAEEDEEQEEEQELEPSAAATDETPS